MVERRAFHNLPAVVKLEVSNNPQLSYVHPQAFRCPTSCLLRAASSSAGWGQRVLSRQVPAVPADPPPAQQPPGPPLRSCLLLPAVPGGGVPALQPPPLRLRLLLGSPPGQPLTPEAAGVRRHPLLLPPPAGGSRAAGGGGGGRVGGGRQLPASHLPLLLPSRPQRERGAAASAGVLGRRPPCPPALLGDPCRRQGEAPGGPPPPPPTFTEGRDADPVQEGRVLDWICPPPPNMDLLDESHVFRQRHRSNRMLFISHLERIDS